MSLSHFPISSFPLSTDGSHPMDVDLESDQHKDNTQGIHSSIADSNRSPMAIARSEAKPATQPEVEATLATEPPPATLGSPLPLLDDGPLTLRELQQMGGSTSREESALWLRLVKILRCHRQVREAACSAPPSGRVSPKGGQSPVNRWATAGGWDFM